MAKKGKLTDEEIAAYTLLGEAGGEGPDGMAAVMHVIKNRAGSSGYPNSLSAVALQNGINKKTGERVYQFTAWSPKHGNKPTAKYKKNSKEFKQALSIVQSVMNGDIPDPTGGALNYYANDGLNAINEPGWFPAVATAGTQQIGNHVFAARNAVRPDAAEYSTRVQAAVRGADAPTPMPGRPAGLSGLSSTATKGWGQVDVNNLLPMKAEPRQSIADAGARVGGGATGVAVERGASELQSRSVKLVPVDPFTGQPVGAKPTATTTPAKAAAVIAGGASKAVVQPTAPQSTKPRTVTVRQDGTEIVNDVAGQTAMPPGARPANIPALPTPTAIPRGGATPSAAGAGLPTPDSKSDRDVRTVQQIGLSVGAAAGANRGASGLPVPTKKAVSTVGGSSTVFVQKQVQVKNPNYVVPMQETLDEQAQMRASINNKKAIANAGALVGGVASKTAATQPPAATPEPEYITQTITVPQRQSVIIPAQAPVQQSAPVAVPQKSYYQQSVEAKAAKTGRRKGQSYGSYLLSSLAKRGTIART